MGDLFAKFLNNVSRGYGQIDKDVFGGLLPGGAATPIGAALQRSGLPKSQQPSAIARRKAALIDAFSTVAAKTQPAVEKAIRFAPEPVQQSISSGLNALPFSVNLFGRYYTGLGAKGLEIPNPILEQVGNTLNQPGYKENLLKNAKEQEKFLSSLLSNPSAQGMDIPGVRKKANDELAEVRSLVERTKRGDLPFGGYALGNNSTNPLYSTDTSLGRVWFTPEKEGYKANEKYDFVYGAADQKQPIGPGMPILDPSQDAALTAAMGIQAPKGAKMTGSVHPLTFLGRSIVMKMPDKSFTYPINIP